jgi:signal peptidase
VLWILAIEVVVVGLLVASFFVPFPGMGTLKVVLSGSMEPSVPVGSAVFILPADTYKVGDVITFHRTGSSMELPVTHRIIGVERERGSVRYVTKGDANENTDQALVAYHEIIGRVVATVPRAGYVIEFARSREGFVAMVAIPATLVILSEVLTLISAVTGKGGTTSAGGGSGAGTSHTRQNLTHGQVVRLQRRSSEAAHPMPFRPINT